MTSATPAPPESLPSGGAMAECEAVNRLCDRSLPFILLRLSTGGPAGVGPLP